MHAFSSFVLTTSTERLFKRCRNGLLQIFLFSVDFATLEVAVFARRWIMRSVCSSVVKTVSMVTLKLTPNNSTVSWITVSMVLLCFLF